MNTKRGIVISPPFTVLGDAQIRVGGSPDSADLRKYLLYWDKIDYADNNLISISPNEDIAYLMEAKVATRTKVYFSGQHILDDRLFIAAQQEAFNRHNEQSPGAWSIAQLSDKLSFVEADFKQCIEFELYNMLPVPESDVSLPDILEFKARRADELLSLRHYLDEMYQQIIGAADVPRERNSQIGKLEQSLVNVDRTLDEFGIRRTLKSLRGYIYTNLGGIVGAGIGGAELSSYFNCTPYFTGLIGAGIMFLTTFALRPKVTNKVHPLAYVNSVKRGL